MRQNFCWLLIVFLLVGCTAPAEQLPTLTATLAAPTITFTLAAPTPTMSPTPLPSNTPAPPTRTPLPTIPTFTPTFDVRTIVTVTPAPQAECPQKDSTLPASFQIPTKSEPIMAGVEKGILDFLNKGGLLQKVVDRLNGMGDPVILDVTGDNTPELVFTDFGIIMHLHIFMCKNGVYQALSPSFAENADSYYSLGYKTHNMNQNGIAEIITLRRSSSGTGYYNIDVFEWNGVTFAALNADIGMDGLNKMEIKDFDHDGLAEFKLIGGLPGQDWFRQQYPLREETLTYKWNGSTFALQFVSYTAPQYRFQAIQDADRLVLNGNFEEALANYQEAIFSQKLEWWSEDRKNNTAFDLMYQSYDPYHPEKIVPADGVPDPTEYPRLAAYAYYRMIALHTYLGENAAAQTQYATLQAKFPAGNPGHPYVEMATDFWDAYQSSQKMYDACAAAIAYADAHPEILTPLGSDYHGSQSHTYTPVDVCPFR